MVVISTFFELLPEVTYGNFMEYELTTVTDSNKVTSNEGHGLAVSIRTLNLKDHVSNFKFEQTKNHVKSLKIGLE